MSRRDSDHWLVVWSVRLYRVAIVAYPPAFRREYGTPMVQVFRDACREALTRTGPRGLIRLWLRTGRDLLSSTARAWLAAFARGAGRQWGFLLALLVALLFAVWTGYTDTHNDEVQAPLLLLLVATGSLGFAMPRRAWLWALLLGLSVPAAEYIALVVGYRVPCHPGYVCPPPTIASTAQTFIVLIPAFLGAYSGAFGRWLLGRLRDQMVV